MDEHNNNHKPGLRCTFLGECHYPKPLKGRTGVSGPRLMTQLAHAIILHPNLGCPQIVKPSDALTVYLLINAELVRNAEASKAFPDAPCLLRNRLNLQLRYFPWTAFDPVRKGQSVRQASCFVEPSPSAYQQLVVSEHQAIDPKKPLLLLDDRQQVFAHISTQLAAHYHSCGFQHWIRVTWLKPNLAEGLYHLIWFSLKSEEDDGELSFSGEMYEPQDELMLLGLQPYEFQYKHAVQISDQAEGLQLDTNQPLQSYHPVYVTNKAYLNLGHLTDIHLSSRQHALQKSKIQVIPGMPPEESPFINTLLHNTYNSIKDLFDQIGQNSEIDCLVLTGDFVDHAFNLNAKYTAAPSISPNQLWEKLNLLAQWKTDVLERTHELGVDQVTLYSFVLYFYQRYQKPVFIVGGNHDGYRYPFGISPRIRSVGASYSKGAQGNALFESTKANAGIPLDHNLTFFEALLIFGPGYRDIITIENFDTDFQLLLWHLFNPLNDWKLVYQQQCFIGLGWGNEESIPYILNAVTECGVLPRASGALSHIQWRILRESPQTRYCILMMHAPVLNFAPEIALRQIHPVTQVIRSNRYVYEDTSPYDQGSFRYYKRRFFEKIIKEQKITHSLSGHSHRSALYCCSSIETLPDLVNQKKTLLRCKYQSFPLEEIIDPQTKIGGLTRCIVTGSAGPLSNVNHDNALGGIGASPPTGTLLFFSEIGDRIQPIYAKCKSAKPRLAALLDYYDLVISKAGFYLPQQQTLIANQPYYFDCDSNWPQPVPLFSAAKLYEYSSDKRIWQSYALQLKKVPLEKKHRYSLVLNEKVLNAFSIKKSEKKIFILSLSFNQSIGSHKMYQSYDLKTPWQFPVDLVFSSSDYDLSKLYVLSRPIVTRERPNFELYKTFFATNAGNTRV